MSVKVKGEGIVLRKAQVADRRTALFLDRAFSVPLMRQAVDADYGLDDAEATRILLHEPSRGVTDHALAIYGLDRELRRMARVMPEVHRQLTFDTLLEGAGSFAANYTGAEVDDPLEIEEFDSEPVRRRADAYPRPMPTRMGGLEYVDTAIGSVDDLLKPVGALLTFINEHPFEAFVGAVAVLANADRAYRNTKGGIQRITNVTRLAGGRAGAITLAAARAWVVQFGPDPHRRYVFLMREHADGTVDGVLLQ